MALMCSHWSSRPALNSKLIPYQKSWLCNACLPAAQTTVPWRSPGAEDQPDFLMTDAQLTQADILALKARSVASSSGLAPIPANASLACDAMQAFRMLSHRNPPLRLARVQGVLLHAANRGQGLGCQSCRTRCQCSRTAVTRSFDIPGP